MLEESKNKFAELLTKYSIAEEDGDADSEFKDRINKILKRLIHQCGKANEGVDADFLDKFLHAVELKDPSVFARNDMVAALASILHDDPIDLEIPEGEEVLPTHRFIMQFVKILSSKNREATVNIFDALLEHFLPDSVHRKDYLHLLVYSDCWSPFNALKMAHRCCNMTVDDGTKFLHQAKTYGVEFGKTYDCLTAEDPLDALSKVIKSDGDKSLDLVITEMRKVDVPEDLLKKVEEIVSKVTCQNRWIVF